MTTVLVAALLAVWLVTRALLFGQMHDLAHSHRFSDLVSLRQHRASTVLAVEKNLVSPAAAVARVAAPTAAAVVAGAGSGSPAAVLAATAVAKPASKSSSMEGGSCHTKKNLEYGGDLGAICAEINETLKYK